MRLLALETSAPVGSLALFDDDRCVDERHLQLGAKHGQSVIAEISGLLRERSLVPSDIEAVAVSIGPGSLTGLRIGTVFAKTWSYITHCALIGVDTHRVIAANAPEDVDRVHVITPAQGGDVYFSRHERSAGDLWHNTAPLAFLPAAEWIAQLGPEEVVTGPGVEKLSPQLSGRCRLLTVECSTPQARHIGRLGLAQLRAGDTSTAWQLEPRYIRRSSAEEKWDLRRRV